MVTRFRCVHCGKITTGRNPQSQWIKGDGSVRFPRRHQHAGAPCPGNILEAEWINVPAPEPRRSK